MFGRRRRGGSDGADAKALSRTLAKDTRGSARLVGSALGPQEKVVNFYRTPDSDHDRGLYVFLTDSRALFAPASGNGDINGHRYVDLCGLRVQGRTFRMAFDYAGVAIRTVTFDVAGAPSEAVGLLIQLSRQWESVTGRSWALSGILDSPRCPPFGAGPVATGGKR